MSRKDFGPNTWLVEELYRHYQEDPESVSETASHRFLMICGPAERLVRPFPPAD